MTILVCMVCAVFPGEWLLKWMVTYPDAAMAVGTTFLVLLGAIGGVITAIARAVASRKLTGSGVDVAMRGLLDILPDVWGLIQTIRQGKSSSAPVVDPAGPPPVADLETAARAAYEATNKSTPWAELGEEMKAYWRDVAKADPTRTRRRRTTTTGGNSDA